MNQSNIRNFAIIAHVDHGKSTLADRMLEMTSTIQKDKMQEQFLDQNPISRERGITIKLAPVRMNYKIPNHNNQNYQEYILNLIDTPGHVDFSYEVSRTLAACEGAIVLVDATQGIQAQTVAHFRSAKKQGLAMIPVVNKIDLPQAQTDVVVKEMVNFLGFSKEEILFISAKTGENVEKVLQKIVEKIPSPKGDANSLLRALIFDAVYDIHRGVVSYIRVVDGSISTNDAVELFQNKVKTQVLEVGYFLPYLTKKEKLETGEIGYMITGVKEIRQARVGDTVISSQSTTHSLQIEPLPGYVVPKPMVFFGMYPKDSKDYLGLKEALAKLSLNDTSLSYTGEYSAYLGSGFRVGFLGLLHAEIVKERVKKEFGLELLLTMPQVLYQKQQDGEMLEPYMTLFVYTPNQYVGAVMTICQKRKGALLDLQYHDAYAVLSYDMPYSMFIRGLSNDIKSVSAGFASLDYEIGQYKKADLVNLDIFINSVVIDVLSELVYKDEALYAARQKAEKLKIALDRQQFRQIIQATVDGTIIAREEIPPFRKDVLAKMSGGDRTRKDKLLEAQKKGKSKLITQGKVVLPQEALLSLIES